MNGTNIMNQKGEQGGKFLGATDSYSQASDGKLAIGFTVLVEANISTITHNYDNSGIVTAAVTLPAGVFVAGAFTELTVGASPADGLVQVHYGEE